jgi:uncharacterized membrane protein
MRSRLLHPAAGIVAAGLAAAAVTTTAGPAAAAPARPGAIPPACSYRLDTRLPVPTGFSAATLSRGDTSGAFYIGSASHREIDDTFHAVRWHDGRVTVLPLPAGFTDSFANAVNTRGDVVGEISGPDFITVPVVWRDGRVIQLSHDPKASARAEAINAAGQIVGTQDTANSNDRTGLVWTVNAPTSSRPIPVPDGFGWGSATALTDTNVLVADLFPTDPTTAPDVIGFGTVSQLRTAPGTADAVGAVAPNDAAGSFIAGDEFVTGDIDLEDRAVRWKGGVPELLSKTASRAFGVNSSGTAAGDDFGPLRVAAVVWTPSGTQVTLPVITTGPAITSSDAATIAADGTVGGNVTASTGIANPVLWHCV